MVFNVPFIRKPRIWRAIPDHVARMNAVAKAMKSLNLKAAKKVETTFDPFHPKVESIRDFVYYTSAVKYRQTNQKCTFKNNICNDRSEPTIEVTLENNNKLIFKTENLNVIELLQLFNKHVSSLYKPEVVPEPITTKSLKLKR